MGKPEVTERSMTWENHSDQVTLLLPVVDVPVEVIVNGVMRRVRR